MISNQILQNTIDGLKTITRIDMCVLDVDVKVLATTSPDASGYEESVSTFAKSPADSQVISGHQFFKVYDDNQLEYILLVMMPSLTPTVTRTKLTMLSPATMTLSAPSA